MSRMIVCMKTLHTTLMLEQAKRLADRAHARSEHITTSQTEARARFTDAVTTLRAAMGAAQ